MTRFPTFDELMSFNSQTLFDHVARHLMQQGARCTKGRSRVCLYRGYNGDACAVGAIIPDALYCEDMEQQAVSGLVAWANQRGGVRMTLFARFLMSHFAILHALQRTHDELHPTQWRRQLERIAEAFHLNADVLRAFEEAPDYFDSPDFDARPANASAFVATVPAAYIIDNDDDAELRRARERAAFVALMTALKNGPPALLLPTPSASSVCDVIA